MMSKFSTLNDFPLTTGQMDRALDTFASCVSAVVRQTAGTDLPAVQQWAHDIMTRVAVMTLRPDSIQEIADSVFKDTVVRDFVLNVSFRFFTLCAEGQDFPRQLAANFVQGLCVDPSNKAASIIPDDVIASMPQAMFANYLGKLGVHNGSREMTMVDFLVNNKILMVVYLFALTQFPPTE